MPVFRALNIAAVSDPKQAAKDKISLADQLELNRRWAAANDTEIVAEITIPGHSRYYTFLDEIVLDCSEYADILRWIRSRNINLILIAYYPRLYRTMELQTAIMAECRTNGVQVFSPVEGGNLQAPDRVRVTAIDKLQDSVRGYRAESEIEALIQRHDTGMKGRIRRGLGGHGGAIPYGYRRVKGQSVLLVVPEEAAIVRHIFERYLAGDSIAAIAEALNARSVPPPSATRPQLDKVTRRREWSVTCISALLDNDYYCGAVRWGQYHNPNGVHEAIVSREDWGRCHAMKRTRLHRSRQAHFNPYTGMARCGLCGYAMAVTWGRNPARAGIIRCSRHVSTRGQECVSNGHSATLVRQHVSASIRDAVAHPAAFLAARHAQRDGGASSKRLDAVMTEIAATEAAMRRWDRAYERDGITLDHYLGHIGRLKASLGILQKDQVALRQLVEQESRIGSHLAEFQPMMDTLDAMTDEELRPIYVALIRELRFYPRQPPNIVWW
jgi:DNA invertase Pin-like site-specific DNA recombinase